MSTIFFDDVLAALGRRVVYEAVVNYAGNAFCEHSWEMIQDHNPFITAKGDGTSTQATNAIAKFFNSANIQVIKPEKSYSEILKEKKARNPNGGKETVNPGNVG